MSGFLANFAPINTRIHEFIHPCYRLFLPSYKVMSDFRIAAIMRSGAFSPNHIGNDAAIFNAVVENLRKRGCKVSTFTEDQFRETETIDAGCIINMCREERSLDRLQTLEDEGRIVINSAYGIRNCERERMCRLLMAHSIPYPETMVVDTDEVVKNKLVKSGFSHCWIKRGDSYKMHKEDVSYARDPEEAQDVLQEYFLRGIRRAVINKHASGDLVKFYGITGSPFFYWYYPFKHYPDAAPERHQTDFDVEVLCGICAEAANVLGIKLWGGDCMVAPDGSLTIIDFNDWPSYAACRSEAAVAIAKSIIADIKKSRI